MIEVLDSGIVNVLIETIGTVGISIETSESVGVSVESPAIVSVKTSDEITLVEVVETPSSTIQILESGEIPLTPEYEIALGVTKSNPLTHKEFIYTDGDISTLNVWTDGTKTQLLISKTFTYSNGDLASIAIAYVGTTVTKTFNYSNGDLVSITDS